MIVLGYTLHLYCDSEKHNSWERNRPPVFAELVHPTKGSACFRDALKMGWKLDRKRGVALCPQCAKTMQLSEIAGPR